MNSQVTVGILKILQMMMVQCFNRMQEKLAKKMLSGSNHTVFFNPHQLSYQLFFPFSLRSVSLQPLVSASLPIPKNSEDNNTQQDLVPSECIPKRRRG